MANMNYCRFQNTAIDLAECVNALRIGEKLSAEEVRALKQIVHLCGKVTALIGENPNYEEIES